MATREVEFDYSIHVLEGGGDQWIRNYYTNPLLVENYDDEVWGFIEFPKLDFNQNSYQMGQIIYFYNLNKQSTATCFILQGDTGGASPTQQFFISTTVYTSLLLSDFESLQLIYVGDNTWVGRFCFDYPEAITVRTSYYSPSPNIPSYPTQPTFPAINY